jgi:hypothetical protein
MFLSFMYMLFLTNDIGTMGCAMHLLTGFIFVKFHFFLFLIKIYIELFIKIGIINCFNYYIGCVRGIWFMLI